MLTLALAAFVGVLVGGGAVAGFVYYQRQKADINEEVEESTESSWDYDFDEDTDAEDVDAGDSVELSPPQVRSGLGALIKLWRFRAKAKKMADRGYVRWYQIGANFQQEKWVKPDYRGQGIGEYHDSDDDVTYFFPKEAMVPDSLTGAYVAIHRVNDADPIDLRDPVMTSVKADRLQEIIDLEVEAEKPGFFDGIDISGTTAFILITVVLFLVYAGSQVMM